jgi:arylsulfatase A-like enzyme
MGFLSTLKLGWLGVWAVVNLPCGVVSADTTRSVKPNVVVLLASGVSAGDLGWESASRGGKAPQISSLAANGVRCEVAYTSGFQAGPARAALLTGRYQSRFGFESNIPARRAADAGLPVREMTLAERLRSAGYVTGMVGEWHLGSAVAMRPYNRGFQETFWHPGGASPLIAPGNAAKEMMRGDQKQQIAESQADSMVREALDFIERNQETPFFLFLSFPGSLTSTLPAAEGSGDLASLQDPNRTGRVAILDRSVGLVLAKLREKGIEESSLVVFLSDKGVRFEKLARNGAPRTGESGAEGTNVRQPMRGERSFFWEKIIRIPMVWQWKGHLPAGKVYRAPVVSLDLFSTALAAAGIASGKPESIDGVNLLPYLEGQRMESPHPALFWRVRSPLAQEMTQNWAIREGRWKLVQTEGMSPALFDLEEDPQETHDLSEDLPAQVELLSESWKRWAVGLRPPLW